MKFKFIVPIFLSILLGFFLGKVFFDQYDAKKMSVWQEGETLYFLQFGVYEKLDALKKNYKDYQDFLTIKEEDGYHLYGAISRSKDTIEEIEAYYQKKDYKTYVKEKQVVNESFLTILTEYEKIVKIAKVEDKIPIERIIMSNYEEMVLEK